MTDKETTAKFWDTQIQTPQPTYWFFYPQVRAYVNECMTGIDWGWPQVWLKSQPQLAYFPLRRGLSIGCGAGNLERSLRNLRVCEEIDAFDLSAESIRAAGEHARNENVSGIRYEVADCEQLDLEAESYDAVFFNHSLHHIADPDALLRNVGRWLKPGGFVYIDDYVGPSRDEWQDSALADRELAPARDALRMIPESMHTGPLFPPLDLSDPSEMVASDRILDAVRAHFEVELERSYWGNLLCPLLTVIDGEQLGRPEHAPLIASLIAREKALVAQGVYTRPLFAFLIARKPRG